MLTVIAVSKSHKLPFSASNSCTTSLFELVDMDVWGPAPIPSFKGFKYYLVVIDGFTRYTWLFPLHYKSDVQSTLSHFKAYVLNYFQFSVKTVRNGNDGEIVNN